MPSRQVNDFFTKRKRERNCVSDLTWPLRSAPVPERVIGPPHPAPALREQTDPHIRRPHHHFNQPDGAPGHLLGPSDADVQGVQTGGRHAASHLLCSPQCPPGHAEDPEGPVHSFPGPVRIREVDQRQARLEVLRLGLRDSLVLLNSTSPVHGKGPSNIHAFGSFRKLKDGHER